MDFYYLESMLLSSDQNFNLFVDIDKVDILLKQIMSIAEEHGWGHVDQVTKKINHLDLKQILKFMGSRHNKIVLVDVHGKLTLAHKNICSSCSKRLTDNCKYKCHCGRIKLCFDCIPRRKYLKHTCGSDSDVIITSQ